MTYLAWAPCRSAQHSGKSGGAFKAARLRGKVVTRGPSDLTSLEVAARASAAANIKKGEMWLDLTGGTRCGRPVDKRV